MEGGGRAPLNGFHHASSKENNRRQAEIGKQHSPNRLSISAAVFFAFPRGHSRWRRKRGVYRSRFS
jgi:hypothetical protein